MYIAPVARQRESQMPSNAYPVDLHPSHRRRHTIHEFVSGDHAASRRPRRSAVDHFSDAVFHMRRAGDQAAEKHRVAARESSRDEASMPFFVKIDSAFHVAARHAALRLVQIGVELFNADKPRNGSRFVVLAGMVTQTPAHRSSIPQY